MMTIGGRSKAKRCQAIAKSGKQCGQPAPTGLDVCRMHKGYKLPIQKKNAPKADTLSTITKEDDADRVKRIQQWEAMIKQAYKWMLKAA